MPDSVGVPTASSSARILVTGAAGQVGQALLAAANGPDVTGYTSGQWDITDPDAAERHIAAGDIVVNCAALTDVDGCESDPERAQRVNADGPARLAAACADVGARLIHISTDYVFGADAGRDRPYEPSDVPEPISVYGASKLAGERAVLAALPDATVVRTAWVYTGGRGGSDFVSVMRDRAQRGQTVRVVDDQIGSPTYAKDLAVALLMIIGAGVSAPILHAANNGAVSRYRQARAVYAAMGVDPGLVEPVASADVPRLARRPAYSALGSYESEEAGFTRLRDWRAALDDAVTGSATAPRR